MGTMACGVILALGLAAGIWAYARREKSWRRSVFESAQRRGGLNREQVVEHFSISVPEPVSAAVFDYLTSLSNFPAVDPDSDLFVIYGLDGDRFEECLDQMQHQLQITNSDFRLARGRQLAGLQTVSDLITFMRDAWAPSGRMQGNTQAR